MTRNRLKQAKIKLVFSSLILMLSIFGSVILSIGASSSKAFASTIPPGWSAPTQIDPVDGRPTSISCVSSSFCIGVDDAGNALNWNGTSWSISAAIDPEAYLSSVSCVSSSFCIVVDASGKYETFNGSIWSAPVLFDTFGSPSSVSCSSLTNCVSVDTSGGVATFNGTTWTSPVQIDPQRQVGANDLTSVSCPATGNCVGVDAGGDSVIQLGGTWQTPVSVDPSNITSVSCSAVGSCVAVDGSGDAVTYSNGSSTSLGQWSSPVQIDALAGLNAVQCVSTFCLAADSLGNVVARNSGIFGSPALADKGSSITALSCGSSSFCIGLSVHGNAATITSGTPSGLKSVESNINQINSISCVSGFCVAVDSAGKAIVWTGSAWSPASTVQQGERLSSVSCVSSTFCVAVGSAGQALTYNGSTWSAPQTIDSSGYINSISCVSNLFCVAVAGNGDEITYTGLWQAPVSVDSNGDLTSVSCYAIQACVAVDGNGFAVVLSTTWASPSKIDTVSGLNSVSCQALVPTGDYCVAVDAQGNSVLYSGGSFSVPASVGTSNSLESVSCYGTSFCTALDFAGNAYTYDLTSWSSPTLMDTFPAHPTSISCTSTSFCMAVDMVGQAMSWMPIAPGAFYGTGPVRICDTRSGANDPATYAGMTLGAGMSLNVNVVSANGDNVPSTATAVVANITAVSSTAGGYFTIWPTGTLRPTVSSLNFSAGEDAVANLVEIPIGANGDISVYNASGSTDLLIDVEGYVAPASSSQGYFNPLSTPVRAADTRTGSGEPLQGKTLGPSGVINIPVLNLGSIPSSGVSAVVANITATNTTNNGGYLTAFPSGGSAGGASTVNFNAGESVPNRVIVPVGSNGDISVENAPFGSVDVIVDITGWFTDSTTSSGYLFHPVIPARILDTRASSGYPGAGSTLVAGKTLSVNVAGVGGIPKGASAIMANVTVTNTTANGGFLTVYPGSTAPSTSDLNWSQGETVPNAVVTALSSSGTVNMITENSNADAIMDVFGWYG